MSFTKTYQPSSVKGRMKCYKCRVQIPAKDGGWHQAESAQVFICKGCVDPRNHEATPAFSSKFASV